MVRAIMSRSPIRTKITTRHIFVFAATVAILSSCATQKSEEKAPALELKAARYSDLRGWGSDDMQTFIEGFSRSCARILKADSAKQFGALKEAGTYKDWQEACRSFESEGKTNPRRFFEDNFIPFAVTAEGESKGLFTGYYEASLRGSSVRTDKYRYPLHSRPNDLVMVDLGLFREDFKGERIAGRVEEGNLKPYEARAQIIDGDWPHTDKVLVWVDDAVDAFFVQIQGSGVVEIADGSTMRIGYAGQNGHPYYAVGRELIKRGELTKETVSMQSIRAWLKAHPDQADEIMNTNKSYVFFKVLEGDGPLGGENVPLTAQRSLAVDRSLLSYGLPLWVDIAPPNADAAPIRRLMIAQDTGGAIRGPVRGDVFWGFGPQAESIAGVMKSEGRYWVLLPKVSGGLGD